MKVIIASEDAVTNAIIRKILDYTSHTFDIVNEVPARGSQIKRKIPELNVLSKSIPVVLLTDLNSSNCAPEFISTYLKSEKDANFILNIAIDEAEAWLLADREGFSKYFSIDLGLLPISHTTKLNGPRDVNEMNVRMKSSSVITYDLVPHISSQELKRQLTPKHGASKGPEYNAGILPFINRHWNIKKAMENSDSLKRMVNRLNKLCEQKSLPVI